MPLVCTLLTIPEEFYVKEGLKRKRLFVSHQNLAVDSMDSILHQETQARILPYGLMKELVNSSIWKPEAIKNDKCRKSADEASLTL